MRAASAFGFASTLVTTGREGGSRRAVAGSLDARCIPGLPGRAVSPQCPAMVVRDAGSSVPRVARGSLLTVRARFELAISGLRCRLRAHLWRGHDLDL